MTKAYVVLVAHVNLDGQLLVRGHEQLEDEELVHNVQARGHSDFLGPRVRTAPVEVSRGHHVLRVRRQLDFVASEAENVALDLRVELFRHLGRAL